MSGAPEAAIHVLGDVGDVAFSRPGIEHRRPNRKDVVDLARMDDSAECVAERNHVDVSRR